MPNADRVSEHAQMRSYVDKALDRRARLARMTDGWVGPSLLLDGGSYPGLSPVCTRSTLRDHLADAMSGRRDMSITTNAGDGFLPCSRLLLMALAYGLNHVSVRKPMSFARSIS